MTLIRSRTANREGPGAARIARDIGILTIAALVLIHGTACSLVAPRMQSISVTSDPAGARVTVNGMSAGVTPTQYKIKKNEEASIVVGKDGYETATRLTSTTLSTIGIVDIIGGCIFLLPFLGLLAPGAWKQEPSNVHLNLYEKPKGDG